MNHDEIARRGVVDRYLLDQLDPGQARRFELHYLSCHRCLAELETTEELLGGLREMAAEDAVRHAVGFGLVAHLARLGRLGQIGVLAILGLVALAPSAVLRHRWNEAEGELAGVRRELSRTLAPQAVVAVLPLNPLRGTPGSSSPSRVIRLGGAAGWIVLSLELDAADTGSASYRVVLRDSADAERWRVDSLVPDASGVLTVTVHASTLPAGDYTLDASSLRDGAAPVDVARFWFRVDS